MFSSCTSPRISWDDRFRYRVVSKEANVQGPLFIVQCLGFIVRCSLFFEAFLVAFHESPQCQCYLGGLVFGCGSSQGQWAHRGGLWVGDGLVGLHNSLWLWWFWDRTGWSADCWFWVAGAGMCWGSGSGNCAWWALASRGFWSWLIGCRSSWCAGCWPQGCWCGRFGRQLSDLSEVIIDGTSRLWCLDRDTSPQKLAVAKGDSTWSIDTYYLLVKLADLYDDASLVPLSGFEYLHGGRLQEVVISWCALSTAQLLSCACS